VRANVIKVSVLFVIDVDPDKYDIGTPRYPVCSV
jgi:hypothetical protein